MAAGAGDGLGHAADGSAHRREKRHFAAGGLMTFRAFGILGTLCDRPHLFEIRFAIRTNIFVNWHNDSPTYSLVRLRNAVKMGMLKLKTKN